MATADTVLAGVRVADRTGVEEDKTTIRVDTTNSRWAVTITTSSRATQTTHKEVVFTLEDAEQRLPTQQNTTRIGTTAGVMDTTWQIGILANHALNQQWGIFTMPPGKTFAMGA